MDFPKIELHAHLNGSITHLLMIELIELYKPEMMQEYLKDYTVERESGMGNLDHSARVPKQRTLESIESFFHLFGFIYRLTDSVECITHLTFKVCEWFWDQGCVYVELRSTPRQAWKQEYIYAVLNGIRIFETIYGGPFSSVGEIEMPHKLRNCINIKDRRNSRPAVVRYIVSLDRRHSPAECIDTIHQVNTMILKDPTVKDYIVGFDICGDPTKGDLCTFGDVFQELKMGGWKVTVHTAEIPNREQETEFALSQLPHRLGHATFLSFEQIEYVQRHQIGVELCISSNLACGTVEDVSLHHFKEYYSGVDGNPKYTNTPICICTDDVGIFGFTLIEEYSLLQKTFSLSPQELFQVSKSAVDAIFAHPRIVDWVRSQFDQYQKSTSVSN